MKVKATYRPSGYRVPQLSKAYDAGLRAAARVQQAALVAEFASRGYGYLNGDYATGRASFIQVGEILAGSGVRRIQVYTDANRNGRPYPFFWEFGHNNPFTKRPEHQPIFQPVLEATADAATQAGWKAFSMKARTMPRNAT
jgi:hypothetical protein